MEHEEPGNDRRSKAAATTMTLDGVSLLVSLVDGRPNQHLTIVSELPLALIVNQLGVVLASAHLHLLASFQHPST